MAVTEQRNPREQILNCLERSASSELRLVVHELHPADLAVILESLPTEDRLQVWLQVPETDMGEILAKVGDGVRKNLIEMMGRNSLVRAIGSLDIDDIAEMVPELSAEIIADIMVTVDVGRRESLGAALNYKENSAGRLMNVDAVAVRESLAVGAVMRYLRVRGELPEYTDKLYVIDRNNNLQGSVLLRNLVTADLHQTIAQIMDPDPISFDPADAQEQVAAVFERYDLTSAPVADASGCLIGRITIDDVVDVIQDSANRKLLAPAGLDDDEDIFAAPLRTTRKRAVWLGVNLVTAVLASLVIGQFEEAIEKLVALAVLMPIIASMGGNAGTQTLTQVIRGLAVGTVSSANAKDVLKKELLVGGLNGLIWAVVVAAVSIFWYHNYGLALIVGAAMAANIVVSAIAGVLLPLCFHRFGIDPALAGGVALTTVTDVIGFLAILGLAALVLV